MKSILLALLVLFGSLSVSGQGTVLFGNRIPGVVDAPVHSPAHGSVGPLDTRFLAQHQYFTGGNWVSVGEPIPLASGTEGVPGYFGPVVLPIPGVFPGQKALVRTAVWYAGLGANFAQAMETYWSGVGLSGEFYVGPLGDGDQTPALLTTFPTGGNAVGLAALPNLALVAAGSEGLQILDLTQPAQPVRIGQWQGTEAAVEVAYRAPFAAVATVGTSGTFLEMVDLSNPSQPQSGSVLPLSTGHPTLLWDHDHLYVAQFYQGIRVFDVLDPTHPRQVGGTTTYYGGGARGMARHQDRLWVADFIAISAFQVGPRLRFHPNQTLELLATPGLPYLIQQHNSWENATWTPWLEITPTNAIQSLTAPPTPEPAGTYFLRATPAP